MKLTKASDATGQSIVAKSMSWLTRQIFTPLNPDAGDSLIDRAFILMSVGMTFTFFLSVLLSLFKEDMDLTDSITIGGSLLLGGLGFYTVFKLIEIVVTRYTKVSGRRRYWVIIGFLFLLSMLLFLSLWFLSFWLWTE